MTALVVVIAVALASPEIRAPRGDEDLPCTNMDTIREHAAHVRGVFYACVYCSHVLLACHAPQNRSLKGELYALRKVTQERDMHLKRGSRKRRSSRVRLPWLKNTSKNVDQRLVHEVEKSTRRTP